MADHDQWLADYAAEMDDADNAQGWAHQLELERKHEMHISQMRESKYLKQSDVLASPNKAMLVTIKGVSEENLAREGDDPEMKYILHFEECKSMVLNWTNIEEIANILDDPETDNWAGNKIVLVHDPNVRFGGKKVGGIRVRKPKAQKEAEPEKDFDDDIPF